MLQEKLPDRRFVRLHLAAAEPQHRARITFLTADPAVPLRSDDNAIITRLAAEDPARARLAAARLQALLGREAELFAWLEQHPDNTTLFSKDPQAALKQALPDLDADFFKGWAAPKP